MGNDEWGDRARGASRSHPLRIEGIDLGIDIDLIDWHVGLVFWMAIQIRRIRRRDVLVRHLQRASQEM